MANINPTEIAGKSLIMPQFLKDIGLYPVTSAASNAANSFLSECTASTSANLTLPSAEWRDNFPKPKRNFIIGQIVKSVLPNPDAEALKDPRIKDLINHARLLEKKFFEEAHDREEYYHLVAEKICYFKKEFERRKLIQKQRKAEILVKGELNPEGEDSSSSLGFSSLSI